MGARYYYILLIALLFSCCKQQEPELPSETQDPTEKQEPPTGTIVYRNDSTEWQVYVFKSGILASDKHAVDSPYHIPTHEEAKILRTITYGPEGQRYMTDDGYTFGMPSSSITKAGEKTKYSLLGLYIRPTVITITF